MTAKNMPSPHASQNPLAIHAPRRTPSRRSARLIGDLTRGPASAGQTATKHAHPNAHATSAAETNEAIHSNPVAP
jgi:hypothetical protein